MPSTSPQRSTEPSVPAAASSSTTWLGAMPFLRNPDFWIPALTLGGLVVYHLAWYSSGDSYPGAALGTILCCLVAVSVLLMLVRSSVIGIAMVVRLFLATGGIGLFALGLTVVMGRATIGSPATTAIVGVLTVLGGVLLFSSGVYLPSEVGTPTTMSAGPEHVSEKRLVVNEADGTVRRYPGFSSGTDRLLDVCLPQLSADDLHYLAYHVDGDCRFSCDLLQDTALERFSDQVTPNERRGRYLQQARYLNRLVVGINNSFREIDSGILIRVVLDVERGALYYYWIDERRFVIGVTLDQEMVDMADRKMIHVVDGVRFSLGHKRIEDLER